MRSPASASSSDGTPITSLTADVRVGDSAEPPVLSSESPAVSGIPYIFRYRRTTSPSGEDTLPVKMNYRSRGLARLVNQKPICGRLKVAATH